MEIISFSVLNSPFCISRRPLMVYTKETSCEWCHVLYVNGVCRTRFQRHVMRETRTVNTGRPKSPKALLGRRRTSSHVNLWPLFAAVTNGSNCVFAVIEAQSVSLETCTCTYVSVAFGATHVSLQTTLSTFPNRVRFNQSSAPVK